MEGKPTQAPKKVSAIALNSTSIKITWTPPSPQYINGINQGYKVSESLVYNIFMKTLYNP